MKIFKPRACAKYKNNEKNKSVVLLRALFHTLTYKVSSFRLVAKKESGNNKMHNTFAQIVLNLAGAQML